MLALIESKFGLFLGLALISMGTGGIKPCVAALVGDQFDEVRFSLNDLIWNKFLGVILSRIFPSHIFLMYASFPKAICA